MHVLEGTTNVGDHHVTRAKLRGCMAWLECPSCHQASISIGWLPYLETAAYRFVTRTRVERALSRIAPPTMPQSATCRPWTPGDIVGRPSAPVYPSRDSP